jgi:hypothetical protein
MANDVVMPPALARFGRASTEQLTDQEAPG